MLKSFVLLFSLTVLCPFSHAQTKRFINPSGCRHAVVVSGGRTVYVSGRVAMIASGTVVGRNNFRAQAKQAFENPRTVPAASGTTPDDVVNYDAEKFRTVREVRDGYLKPTNRPASPLVGVQARFRPELLVEVDAEAVVSR